MDAVPAPPVPLYVDEDALDLDQLISPAERPRVIVMLQ
jgi:hypothetical protein